MSDHTDETQAQGTSEPPAGTPRHALTCGSCEMTYYGEEPIEECPTCAANPPVTYVSTVRLSPEDELSLREDAHRLVADFGIPCLRLVTETRDHSQECDFAFHVMRTRLLTDRRWVVGLAENFFPFMATEYERGRLEACLDIARTLAAGRG